jgi:hypothetical protein
MGLKRVIKVREDKKSGEFYLRLKDFSKMVDVSKVKSYTLEPVHDDSPEHEPVRCLILKFYDEDGNPVEAKS